MVASFAATFLHHALLPVDCKSLRMPDDSLRSLHIPDSFTRFAFVEYESRRDADDAYHEMHNKRIGRDDLLKIEVNLFTLPPMSVGILTWHSVGSYSPFCLLAI